MNERRYLVDVLQAVVAQVETNLLPVLQQVESTIEAVSYQFGHPLEIIETLRQRDESGIFTFKKYPLVALFTDIDEEKGVLGTYSSANVTILVIHHTLQEYKAKERLEMVFKPIIHPIVDSLLQAIADSPYFLEFDPDLIERTETDRYYWGKYAIAANTAIRFNDHVDATELRLSLRLSPFCVLN